MTVPAMTPGKTQLLIAPDAQSFAAPSATTNATIPIANLILERASYISLKNMIVGLAPVRWLLKKSEVGNAYQVGVARAPGGKAAPSTEVQSAAKTGVRLSIG